MTDEPEMVDDPETKVMIKFTDEKMQFNFEWGCNDQFTEKMGDSDDSDDCGDSNDYGDSDSMECEASDNDSDVDPMEHLPIDDKWC